MPLTPKTTRRATTTAIAGRYLATEDDTLVPITSTITRLGRSLGADIELDEPSVSRRHALIVREDADAFLLDDHSRNGTFHNGIRVERALLRDGDTIELGTARLRFVEVAEAATDELIAA